MRIIQVSYRFPPAIGGVENHVYNLAYRLSEEHKVTVFTSDIENIGLFKIQRVNKSYEKLSDNLDVFRLRAYPPGIPYAMTYAMIPSLIRKLAGSHVDVIHTHGYIALHSDVTSIISKLKETPLVLTVHAYGDRLSNRYKNLFSRLYNSTMGKAILNYAGKIIVLDPKALRYFLNLGVEKEKIQVIPNGIEYNKFAKSQLSRDFRQKYDINGKIVLFVGQLQQRKGVQHLFRSAPQILKEVPDANFFIVGDGGFKKNLVEISNNLGIKGRVKFTDFLPIEELLEVYASADVFVLPSAFEGLPTVILEAMASGKPIVATNVGGISSIVKEGVNGFVIDYENLEQLAKSITIILTDEKLAKIMGENGREIAKNCDWSVISKKIEHVYQEVL